MFRHPQQSASPPLAPQVYPRLPRHPQHPGHYQPHAIGMQQQQHAHAASIHQQLQFQLQQQQQLLHHHQQQQQQYRHLQHQQNQHQGEQQHDQHYHHPHHQPHSQQPPPGFDPELDDLLDVLEYIRQRWNRSHTAQVGISKRIPSDQKRDFALSLARAVDLDIAHSNQPDGSKVASTSGGGIQRSASSQTMHNPTASVNGLAAQRHQRQQKVYEEQSKRKQQKEQRRQQEQEKRGARDPASCPPSPVPDISEASALLLRTVAAAKHKEAAASIALLAGIPLPLEFDTAAAAAAAAKDWGGGDGDGSGQGSGTEEEEDSPTHLEEFELFMTAAQRANGGGAGGKGGKEKDMGPLRFNDDPKWYFVHCAVPWTGQVGITVVNATLPVGGRHRHVLSVTVVAKDGSGYRAGVRAGDCISKVEGRDVTGMPCAELMSTLRDLLQARKQIDPFPTLEFIFARNLSAHQRTCTGITADTTATADAIIAFPSVAAADSTSSLSAYTSSGSSTTPESAMEPHTLDTLTKADSSSSVASTTAGVAAISLAAASAGESGMDVKSEERRAKAKGRASDAADLNDGGNELAASSLDADSTSAAERKDGKGKQKKEEVKEEVEVEEEGVDKQKDGVGTRKAAAETTSPAGSESSRRRRRTPGGAEKESPSKRRQRKDEGASSMGVNAEEDVGGTSNMASKRKLPVGEEDRCKEGQQQQKSSSDATCRSPTRSSRGGLSLCTEGSALLIEKEVKPGELAWARFEKLPKWPCRVEEVAEPAAQDGRSEAGEGGKKPMAVVHFFGDAGPETVPVASLEPFESSFRRLYKRRHEKIYVRAVSQACVHVMTQKGLNSAALAAHLDVAPRTLEVYMEDAAGYKMLESGSKRHVRRTSAPADGGGKGVPEGLQETAGSTGKDSEKLSPYHVDPAQLHDTKKTGIFTEAWF